MCVYTECVTSRVQQIKESAFINARFVPGTGLMTSVTHSQSSTAPLSKLFYSISDEEAEAESFLTIRL